MEGTPGTDLLGLKGKRVFMTRACTGQNNGVAKTWPSAFSSHDLPLFAMYLKPIWTPPPPTPVSLFTALPKSAVFRSICVLLPECESCEVFLLGNKVHQESPGTCPWLVWLTHLRRQCHFTTYSDILNLFKLKHKCSCRTLSIVCKKCDILGFFDKLVWKVIEGDGNLVGAPRSPPSSARN